MKLWVHSRRFLWILVVAVAAGILGQRPAFAAPMDAAVPEIVDKVSPSVVAIIGKPSGSQGSWTNDRYSLSHGTGVIVREDGLIITNAHVVEDMRNLVVVTLEGKSYNGRVTHYDEDSDLALVQIDATGLPAVTFAEKEAVQVGETVVAIGTPVSFNLRNSATAGIVSGIDRSVNSKYQLLQTDAAINPGNSGGALVNLKGEVIGINTLKYADYGIDNLGFAIPADTVQYVLEHFLTYGKVKRPYLGLELEESWEAIVGLPAEEGLRVVYVEPGSPAAAAGIKTGDVMLAFDSREVRTSAEFNELLKLYLPEETVKVTMRTEDGTVVRTLTLGEEVGTQYSWNGEEDDDGIIGDAGKTKIGDSEFGWTMTYPASAFRSSYSDDKSVMLIDAKGEFMLNISILDNQSPDLSPAGLLRIMTDQQLSGGTVLEKRYVEDADVPYGKLAGKYPYGGYYQTRAFLHQETIYFVTLYLEDDQQIRNRFKMNRYNDLLDSFTLSFQADDDSVKDLAQSRGSNTFVTEYGLSFELPAGWEEGFGDLSYVDADYSMDLTIRVTSAAGQSLKAWTAKQEQRFADTFVDGFRKMERLELQEVDGVPAAGVHYAWTMGGNWTHRYEASFIKDKYRYTFSLEFEEDSDEEAALELFYDILASVEIDKERMNPAVGIIQDEEELADPDQTVQITNKKYKYTLRLPETWRSYRFYSEDPQTAIYYFFGGSFSIEADERNGFDKVWKNLEKEHRKNKETDGEYEYTVTDGQLFGTDAKRIDVDYVTESDEPYLQTEYVVEKDGLTYTVRYRVHDAVRTERLMRQLEAALQSMRTLE